LVTIAWQVSGRRQAVRAGHEQVSSAYEERCDSAPDAES